jgi:hypothetical protein
MENLGDSHTPHSLQDLHGVMQTGNSGIFKSHRKAAELRRLESDLACARFAWFEGAGISLTQSERW